MTDSMTGEQKMIVTCTAIITVAILAVLVTPIILLVTHGTERMNECVKHGGSYVKVQSEDYYECRKTNG